MTITAEAINAAADGVHQFRCPDAADGSPCLAGPTDADFGYARAALTRGAPHLLDDRYHAGRVDGENFGRAAERERVMAEVSAHRFHDECKRGDDCPNVYHVRVILAGTP